MKLTRSDFLRSPAEHLINAEDAYEQIELVRYKRRTHVILSLEDFNVDAKLQKRDAYLYDLGVEGISSKPDDENVGLVVTVRRMNAKEACELLKEGEL